MDCGNLTLEEIRQGYRFEKKTGERVCNYCGTVFPEGQIFFVDGNFYDAERAVARHIEGEHGGNLLRLLRADTKYNTLTETQKELLALFHSKLSDSEIAQNLGLSPSTVRRQKFAFREKAKQARMYLAVFENAFADRPASGESLISVHDHAACLDERYVITEQERSRILKAAFESLDPPRLKNFPVKEKKKIVILTKIAELFEPGRDYAEKEVNRILKAVYEDCAALRRYLVDYGFMTRERDGSGYRLR